MLVDWATREGYTVSSATSDARLLAALVRTPARLSDARGRDALAMLDVLNLVPQAGETDGFSPEEHLRVLLAHCEGVSLHTVIADAAAVVDRRGLLSAVQGCGAELVLAPVAAPDGAPRHDPSRLAAALASVVGAR